MKKWPSFRQSNPETPLTCAEGCRGAADKKTTHCGCDGAHLPYLVNDMGNPWVKKFDPYPYPSSRGTGGFRVVWMMFERSEGVVAVAFRVMEGVAGREGPSIRISSNGGGGGRQRDPSTRVSSHRGGESRWKLQVVSYCSM